MIEGLRLPWYVCDECDFETIFPHNRRCLMCGATTILRPLSIFEMRQRGLARDPSEQAIAVEDKPKNKRWYKK